VFNVAVDFGTRVDGRWETKAMFIKVELWGNRAETLHDWFDKGSPIAFSGELREDEWTDREGATRKSLACKASSVEPIETKAQREDRRGGKKSGGGGSGWDPDAGSSGSDVDEDIPF
jgi:single-stranded DNA-binding protein